MAELFKTRCAQGKLIITDEYIRVELGQLKQQTLYRSVMTGIDLKVTVFPFLWAKGAATLTFHGQGVERMQATMVKLPVAREIVGLLQKPQK